MNVDRGAIEAAVAAAPVPEPSRVREALSRARELKGLDAADVLTLLAVEDPDLLQECFETARWAKDEIYGKRIVYFAPLYVSNLCGNDCPYCAFRAANRTLARRALSQDEVRRETEVLVSQGHKRVLLVSGESYPAEGLGSLFDSIRTVYSARGPKGGIRRVNVNIAPLAVDEFRALQKEGIGTYQLFQETYHEPTYRRLHRRGKKADYNWRLEVMDRALEAGIHDVGIGALFGLHDWRFEVLALLSHVRHLEARFGVGPHTISVPRLEPAHGSPLSRRPPHALGDRDFLKLVAVLRLAVPYTGLILSTRESVAVRRRALELGISQISAGSRTDAGGYSDAGEPGPGQFSVGDTRALSEVIEDVLEHGHIPSFCTGCYRRGRVGKDFMDLAKPGLIKEHCLPNALLTFSEYLHDFAEPALARKGFAAIERMADGDVPAAVRGKVREMLRRVHEGERDLYL